MTKHELVTIVAAVMWAGVTAAEDTEGASYDQAVMWARDLVDLVAAKVPEE